MDFDELRAGILACRLCRERFGFEPHPVFQGSPRSKIMQLSQAPSQTVHRTGRPFDHASGKKLRGAWYGISDETFYDPENFYIVSMAHCFPGKAPGGGDRLPPAICAETWLCHELEAPDNRLYIIIGGVAARRLFPGEAFTPLVFRDQTLCGKPAFVLPHPSPLNVKWFRDHPAFEEERLPRIREAVHEALGRQAPRGGV